MMSVDAAEPGSGAHSSPGVENLCLLLAVHCSRQIKLAELTCSLQKVQLCSWRTSQGNIQYDPVSPKSQKVKIKPTSKVSVEHQVQQKLSSLIPRYPLDSISVTLSPKTQNSSILQSYLIEWRQLGIYARPRAYNNK